MADTRNDRPRRGRGKSRTTLLEDPRVAPEIERCREVLRIALRVLGVPIREIERRTGRTHTYWNNVLSGEIGLSFKLLLALAYALEIEPAELFGLLYPLRPCSPSPGGLRLALAAERLGGVRGNDQVVIAPSSSQARTRWRQCAEACGYGSVEEWVAAAAEAEVLRQRAARLGEEAS